MRKFFYFACNEKEYNISIVLERKHFPITNVYVYNIIEFSEQRAIKKIKKIFEDPDMALKIYNVADYKLISIKPFSS